MVKVLSTLFSTFFSSVLPKLQVIAIISISSLWAASYFKAKRIARASSPPASVFIINFLGFTDFSANFA